MESLDELTVIILYGLLYIVECNYNKKSQELLYPSDKSFDYTLALKSFYNNPLVTKGESGATYEYFDYLQDDYRDKNTIGIEFNPIEKFLSSKARQSGLLKPVWSGGGVSWYKYHLWKVSLRLHWNMEGGLLSLDRS